MKFEWDLKELYEFGDRVSDVYKFETTLMDITQKIARVLHQNLLDTTPIDTGNLRKMWSAGDNLYFTVDEVVDGYEVTLINTAQNSTGFKYGNAVNDGHTTPGGGWVMGRFFVEKSILKTENNKALERIVSNELDEWFRWCLNG